MVLKILATCLFLGLLPGAPGTWGSLGSVIVGLVFGESFGTLTGGLIMLAISVALAPVGISVGTWAESHYGKKDPSPFVLDEFVGQGLAMGLAMILMPGASVRLIAPVAFIAFRIFDIAKIYPANRAEKLPGGTGIMLDDIVAGIYAAAVTTLFLMVVG